MPAVMEGPRHAVITADDIGPIIQIVAWFLMVVMILATMLRLTIRFTTVHVPGADDALVSFATLLGIGEVIAASLAVKDGLGTRPKLLTADQLTKVEKGVYAMNILYILTIACAKASTTLLLYRLLNVRWHLNLVRILAGFVFVWMLAAVFGQAFQCTVPRPWDVIGDSCISIPSFWDGIGAVDILLDLCLIAMPAVVVWDLQMPWSRKLIVISGFSFRLCLCAAQIIRLVYLTRANHASDSTFIYETLGYTLATQCETTLSVIAACIPALKPFMDRAASGLMGISFSDRQGTYDVSANGGKGQGNGSYEMPELANKRKSAGISPGRGGLLGRMGSSFSGAAGRGNVNSTQISSASQMGVGKSGKGASKAAAENGASAGAGEDYMIHKTMDWEVQYSDEARLNSVSQMQEHQLPLQGTHQTSSQQNLHQRISAEGEAGHSESGSATGIAVSRGTTPGNYNGAVQGLNVL